MWLSLRRFKHLPTKTTDSRQLYACHYVIHIYVRKAAAQRDILRIEHVRLHLQSDSVGRENESGSIAPVPICKCICAHTRALWSMVPVSKCYNRNGVEVSRNAKYSSSLCRSLLCLLSIYLYIKCIYMGDCCTCRRQMEI